MVSCPICGGQFAPNRKNQQTCGHFECSRKHWENRNRERSLTATRKRQNHQYATDPSFRAKKVRDCRVYRYKKAGVRDPEEAARRYEAAECCEVCLRPKTEVLLHLHHDHKTGEILGVVCSEDNLADGKAGGDAARLLRLAALRLRMPLDNLSLTAYGT